MVIYGCKKFYNIGPWCPCYKTFLFLPLMLPQNKLSVCLFNSSKIFLPTNAMSFCLKERQKDKQTQRQTDKKVNIQKDALKLSKKVRQTDRQKGKHTKRRTET